MYFPISQNNNVHALTTCLLEYINFRLRDIHINVLRFNGTLSDRCVVCDWHMIVYWDRIIVWGWKLVVIYLNQLFFIKATKAAGQDSLSKFEAVECSKIKATGSGAASTAMSAPLFLLKKH